MTAPSPVRRFRKRPVVVSAIRWTGGNEAEVREFAGGLFGTVTPDARAAQADPEITAEVYDKLHSTWVGVKTGQWVVRGIRGEFYPLDEEIRQETYDPADGPEAPGMTPGHAVYEAHQAFMIRCFPGIARIGWEELSPEAQAQWEGIARAPIAAYIEANGRDPVDAASVIAEVIVPELAELRDMLDEATRTMLNLGTRPAEVNLAHRLRKQAGLAP